MQILKKPELICAFIFALLPLLFPAFGGMNAGSRLAAMAAFKEQDSFEIGSYVRADPSWTVDWSSSDGEKFYSNKNPGGILLAYPVFWIYDSIVTFKLASRHDRDTYRYWHQKYYGAVLSFFLQILPMIFLFFFLQSSALLPSNPSLSERWIFSLAYFFASTTTLVAGLYLVHSLVFALILGAIISLKRSAWAWAAGLSAMAVITEPSALFMLPGLILFVPSPWEKIKNLGSRQWLCILIALAVPLGVAVIYQKLCFGEFFSLPQKFNNPEFLPNPTLSQERNTGLHVFSAFPGWWTLKELLVGYSRGLLWTQSWVLLLLGAFLMSPKKYWRERIWRFLIPSFALYFWMNSTFAGWHGGAAPGPRYLAPILGFFSLALIPAWRSQGKLFQRGMTLSILFSVIFYFHLHLGRNLLRPEHEPIWGSLHHKVARFFN